MIRHIVLHRLKPDATEEAIAAWKAASLDLCRESAEVLNFSFGTNIGSGPSHYDTAFVMDFESLETFRAYVGSDRHQAYVKEHAIPVVDTLAAIQHDLSV